MARLARALWRARFVALVGPAITFAALGSTPARGQPLTSLEFSFSNPGARSLGFGGAFVALADDATAAFANPAGLVQISRAELSVEARSWRYTTPFTRGGRAAGEPTGLGIDTVAAPLRGESSAGLTGLSYASYVYPRKRWSLAVFQHQLANFEFGLETQGLFGPGEVALGSGRSAIQRSRLDFEIVSHGVAVAYRPVDELSVGIGLTSFDPHFAFVGFDHSPDSDTVESLFASASFLPERLVQIASLRMGSPDTGLSAGFLWRLSDRWTLGGVYREGPEFLFELEAEAGPAHPVFPAGSKLIEGFTAPWEFPDVYALGIGYRSSSGRWTAACEWKRVEYSTIVESFLPQRRDPGDFLTDADELHLGGEYAFFVGTSVLAVRAGVWHDPDHDFDTRSEEPFARAVLVPGEDELHFAAGLGAAFRRLQIDLGIDLSNRVDTISLSTIYGFGG